MLNPIRRYKSDMFCGDCEFPSCSNKVIDKNIRVKYCVSHMVERKNNPVKFHEAVRNG